MAQRGNLDVKPELLLQGERVHLHDHPVDLVLQRVALLAPLLAEGQDRVQAAARLRRVVGLEAPALQLLQGLGLRANPGALQVRDRIREHVQPAALRDLRVQALDGPGRRVARVGEGRLLALHPLAVHRLEPGPGEEHLAAHLQSGGDVPPGEGERHGPDRAHVGRDVVAPDAVAAGDAADEPALLVVQGHGKAVHLQLGHVLHLPLADQAEDPRLELAQLVLAVGVVQAEHGSAMDELREGLGGLLPHALGGAVGGDEVGMPRLELAQLPLERVVLLVADLRRVLLVVRAARDGGSPPAARRCAPRPGRGPGAPRRS